MDDDTIWAKGAYAAKTDDEKWSIRVISTNGTEDWITEMTAIFNDRHDAELVILDGHEVLGPLISMPETAHGPATPEGATRP